MTIGLTHRQQDCLALIETGIRERGIVPSVEQLAHGLGLKSKSGVIRLLDALQERGKIRRLPRRARAIELIGNGLKCPHCGYLAGSDICLATARAENNERDIPIRGTAPVRSAAQ